MRSPWARDLATTAGHFATRYLRWVTLGESIIDTWYVEEGGPIALWRAWADDVRGWALNAGHFFPEEAPEQAAEALNRFFGAAESSDLRASIDEPDIS